MDRVFLFLYLLFLSSCGKLNSEKRNLDVVEEIRLGRSLKPSEIIRNPLSEAGLDTSKIAKIKFQKEIINFGVANEGDLIEKTFIFINAGNFPLNILEAFSSCGCTVPKWPKEVILPGEEGLILVQFNTEGKVHYQRKSVTIVANTLPAETIVYLEGEVIPKVK